MDALRQYAVSVIAAAIVCGIVTGSFQNGTVKEIVKLVCGLFLTFTVIHPVIGLDITSLSIYQPDYTLDASKAAAIGENFTREGIADIIKTETETYILDKAAELNADLTATVTVSQADTPVPVAVSISGEVTPYARQQLQGIIQSDLGIAKENQVWSGQN